MKPGAATARYPGGFTLLELLVVLFIVGLLGGGLVMALEPAGQRAAEREAQRLAALLESARVASRTSGQTVLWRATASGFELPGLEYTRGQPQDGAPQWPWLHEAVSVAVLQPAGAQTLVLGPEPLIPAQRLQLQVQGRVVEIATDGLGPFRLP